jgi:pyruvate/2-oxoglutarate dehydrogenase complex dihydrolipoamide dehydrogenase (E3) component
VIYAIGGAAGADAADAASHQAGLVLRSLLFRLPARYRPERIPRLVLTDPEIASVGLDESAARAAGTEIRVLRWPYRENDRAQAERLTHGHVKVIADRRGRILGATIVGAHAGELILPWALAVSQGLRVGAMSALAAPHPSLGEIGPRAAIGAYTLRLTQPRVRRIISFLRRFG